jgi:cytochrome P450
MVLCHQSGTWREHPLFHLRGMLLHRRTCILSERYRTNYATVELEKGALRMIQRPSSLDQLTKALAYLQHMRESHPVVYDEGTARWHLFGYQEVEQALTDSIHFSSEEPHSAAFPHALSPLDSDHRRHSLRRKMITHALPPHAVNQLTPSLRAQVQSLLGR